jgi:AcrR family transcriptional regulator
VLVLQKRRILTAAIELIASEGVAAVSIGRVCRRAGVSRKTFYEIFADRDECFTAAFERAVEQAEAVVVPVYEGEERWRERIRAGLAVLLGFLDAEPALARLLIVEALAGGPLTLAARARVIDALIARVDDGRSEARAGRTTPRLSAEGVVGAVLAVLHARLLACSPPAREDASARRSLRGLRELTSQLMEIIVLPYLGPAAAERESSRSTPSVKVPAQSIQALSDPFKDLPMRLTYRTAQVLSSIASTPGASSKHVAATAGISDEGQTSRLLGRLERLGLVQNNGGASGRGEAKAWTLTQRGHGVIQAVTNGDGSHEMALNGGESSRRS